jgi:hypothetical protein
MGALAGWCGRHRSRIAGAAAVALAAAALSAPAGASVRRHVQWETGGGIGGGTGTALAVYTDRTGRAEEGGATARFELTRREWSALRERLRAARFGTLARRYAPTPRILDSTYDIVRHRGRTVTVWTGGDPPRRLVRLIRHLARLHRAHEPSR